MRSDTSRFLWHVVLCFLLVYAASCGTARSIYKKVSPGGTDGLKKKVMVLPFIDQSGADGDRATQMTDRFVKLLEKDEHLLVRKAEIPVSGADIRSPEFGIVIDPDIAKMAEELGMNVLISGSVNPVEVRFVKKGIWPFRKQKRQAEISVLINAVDIINGTLFLTNLENKTITIQEPKDVFVDETMNEEIDDALLDKILDRLLQRHASAVIGELEEHPWSGRLISVNGKSLFLSVGSDVGVIKGRIFEVYGKGEAIHSVSGRPLHLLGPKIGEVKIFQVMETYSSATPLTEGLYEAGQIVRVKN
jgi:hypothetical protein